MYYSPCWIICWIFVTENERVSDWDIQKGKETPKTHVDRNRVGNNDREILLLDVDISKTFNHLRFTYKRAIRIFSFGNILEM